MLQRANFSIGSKIRGTYLICSSYRLFSSVNTEDLKCIYNAPFATPLKRLKQFSIVSCSASILASPLLIFASGDSVSTMSKVMLTVPLVGFGVFSTALLYWFASPYVTRIFLSSLHNNYVIEKYNFFAKSYLVQVSKDSITIKHNSANPMATFAALNMSETKNELFYIHEPMKLPKEIENNDQLTKEEIEEMKANYQDEIQNNDPYFIQLVNQLDHQRLLQEQSIERKEEDEK